MKSDLAIINQKIVEDDEFLPEVKLKDGSKVQTGTVATMLHNIYLYNNQYSEEIERELILAIPTLFKIGLFNLFKPEEWVSGDNAGRKFVGEQALIYLDSLNRKT